MWYDVLVVGVLLFAVIRGAMKGIVWQLATIAALLLCFAFSESLSLMIAPYITLQPPLNRWVAMFGLYLGFSFLSFATARYLKKWIEKAEFQEYDRHLGSIFGFVKGVIFVLVMTFFGVTLTQQFPGVKEAIFHSQTGKLSAVVMDRLHPVMPTELHDVLEPYIHSLDRDDLELHAHNDDEDGEDSDLHNHGGTPPQPLEAPPFPTSPRRGVGDDSLSGPADDRDDPLGLPNFPGDLRDNNDPWFTPEPIDPRSTDREPVTDNRQERLRKLRDAAELLAQSPEAQRSIIEEIEKSLAGLPDQIQNAVVADWYADLLAFDSANDPDPSTNFSTRFDERIVRQLTAARVPWSELDTALQRRLQNFRR